MESNRKKSKLTTRILAFTLIVALLFVVLLGRVGYLQFIKGGELRQMALDQQTKESEINPRRGSILDRNGKELAISASVDTVAVDPKRIREAGNREAVINTLSEVLGVEKADVAKQLDKNSRFEYVKKRIDTSQSKILRSYISGEDENGNELSQETLEKHDLTGVSLIADTKRFYPYGELAAQVLGVVGTDNQGLEGLEYEYDAYLKGTAGRIVQSNSAVGSPSFDFEEFYNAQAGSNIKLTIDESIQRIVEKALNEAYIENKAANGGCAIVMNPNTGEILAMATVPTYNLNEPIKIKDPDVLAQLEALEGEEYSKAYVAATSGLKRNKPVVDVYEPGSTFKLITCAMSLEEQVATLEETYNCNGYMHMGGHNIHCWRTAGHGTQTFMTGMVNSCNPVLMQVGAKIGTTNFYKNFKLFGFRDVTGIDFPGEAVGSFHTEEAFSEVDLAVSSFGQSFEVTPLQMITAISSLVNGGNLYRPYLVKEIQSADGQPIETILPQKVRQTVSAETSEKMKTVLETVVLQSGSTAYVKGYRIGGKSGTSEKQPRGSGKYIGSFVGVAPVDDPKIVCLVIIDEPTGENYYGGVITAPVAGKIISETLQYYGIEPVYTEEDLQEMDTTVPDVVGKTTEEAKRSLDSFNLKYSVNGNGDQIVAQIPAAGSKVRSSSSITIYTGLKGDPMLIKVPNVVGSSAEAANETLTNSGLAMKISGAGSLNGKGIITSQSPAAGALLDEGETVTVYFSKEENQ